MSKLSISANKTIHKLQNVMFESSFYPDVALLILHFLLYPIKMDILAHIVPSLRFFIAKLAITLQFSIRYFIDLSKTANIISLSYILCQLLGADQSHPL